MFGSTLELGQIVRVIKFVCEKDSVWNYVTKKLPIEQFPYFQEVIISLGLINLGIGARLQIKTSDISQLFLKVVEASKQVQPMI